MSREHVISDPPAVVPYFAASYSLARRYRDLCSTCSHAEACGGRSTLERPIFFCEMFEVSAPGSALTQAAAAAPSDGPDAGKYKGLCLNCENRADCTAPKSPGGVWHCEEYQ